MIYVIIFLFKNVYDLFISLNFYAFFFMIKLFIIKVIMMFLYHEIIKINWFIKKLFLYFISFGHIVAPGKPLHLFFWFFLHTCFVVGDGTKICFWEDLWWEDQPLCSQFPRPFKFVTTENIFVLAILGNDSSPSWDLFFPL